MDKRVQAALTEYDSAFKKYKKVCTELKEEREKFHSGNDGYEVSFENGKIRSLRERVGDYENKVNRWASIAFNIATVTDMIEREEFNSDKYHKDDD